MIAGLKLWLNANRLPLIGGAIALAVIGFFIWLAVHDSNVRTKDRLEHDNQVLTNQVAAGAAAGEEHINDASRIRNQSEAFNHAIDTASPSAPSPAALALNCERLRRAGKDLRRYPACAGHQDLSHGKARPD